MKNKYSIIVAIFYFFILACSTERSYSIEAYSLDLIKTNNYNLVDVHKYFKVLDLSLDLKGKYSGAILSNNNLFIHTMSGYLYLINIRDKTLNLIYNFDETMGGNSAIYNSNIYLYSRNGVLYFYDFIKNKLNYKDDKVIAKTEIKFNIIGNYLYFADDDTNIVRYNLITNNKDIIYFVGKEIEDILDVKKNILIKVYGKIFSYNIIEKKSIGNILLMNQIILKY